MKPCEICKNVMGNKSHIVREMMFGYKDEFEYIECAKCGILQIANIPENLPKYYPKNYYSFLSLDNLRENSLKSFLKKRRALNYFDRRNIIGILVSKIFGMPYYYSWLKRAKIKFESKILDVGCGAGNLLLALRKEGFLDLTGVDPFINDNILYENGVKIFKKDLADIEGVFDFIMLNHSFEHMPNPLSVFKELYRLLNFNCYILIRIPVVSFAWRKYGVNWVQLDAPRHLFSYTIRGIQILANEVGFKISDIIFDSTEFQFWGSEQYLKDIALQDNNSYSENPRKSIFSKKQIEIFRTKAKELDKNRDGDQACFYLYKSS